MAQYVAKLKWIFYPTVLKPSVKNSLSKKHGFYGLTCKVRSLEGDKHLRPLLKYIYRLAGVPALQRYQFISRSVVQV